MTEEPKPYHPAHTDPCADCPWRTSNQGRRHPHGWFTKRNLDRLWAGMRRGKQMTCHPTDPRNEVPEGGKTVSENAKTRECAGALIMQQRELQKAQYIVSRGGNFTEYRRQFPRGLTREGILEIMGRLIPFPGEVPMTYTNLNAPVDHVAAVGEWAAEDWIMEEATDVNAPAEP